jgi:hypothetical protein
MALGQDIADYIAKYKNQRKKVREAFNKDEGQRGSVDRKAQDYKGPKAPNFSVPKDSGKIKPAQNKVTPAVSDNIIPSHLKNSNATTQEPKYPLRVTAADKGGLQVKSPSANDNAVTGNLSTKRIDMHQQARNMINRPTSVEDMKKRRK